MNVFYVKYKRRDDYGHFFLIQPAQAKHTVVNTIFNQGDGHIASKRTPEKYTH